MRGEGGAGEEVGVVGGEEGEGRVEGFRGEGRGGGAGAGEEVGEGAEAGFERGDLGGVVADEGLVGREPVGWEGGVGGWEVEAGGEGGRRGGGGGGGGRGFRRRRRGGREIVRLVDCHDAGDWPDALECCVLAVLVRVESSSSRNGGWQFRLH